MMGGDRFRAVTSPPTSTIVARPYGADGCAPFFGAPDRPYVPKAGGCERRRCTQVRSIRPVRCPAEMLLNCTSIVNRGRLRLANADDDSQSSGATIDPAS